MAIFTNVHAGDNVDVLEDRQLSSVKISSVYTNPQKVNAKKKKLEVYIGMVFLNVILIKYTIEKSNLLLICRSSNVRR